MIQVASVGPAFGNFTHFNLFAPKPGNEYSFSRYKSEMLRLYELLNTRLGQAKYLGGDEYSIADMATFPWTRAHEQHGAKMNEKPNLKRWFDELSARAGGQGDDRQAGRHQVEPRNGDRRQQGSLLQSRQIREGVSAMTTAARAVLLRTLLAPLLLAGRAVHGARHRITTPHAKSRWSRRMRPAARSI